MCFEKVIMYVTGMCMTIGRRRVFALSQAVSTAASAFLLKLTLLIEGHIDASVADKWLSCGFLIVFEGLLSVSGKEKSMLEDTQSAVEALKLFQIRVLPSPTPGGASSSHLSNNYNNHSSRQAVMGSYAHTQTHTHTLSYDTLDIGFSGREIRVYVPPVCVARLPTAYKQKVMAADGQGAVLSLVPVLFTQVCVMSYVMCLSVFCGALLWGVLFRISGLSSVYTPL